MADLGPHEDGSCGIIYGWQLWDYVRMAVVRLYAMTVVVLYAMAVVGPHEDGSCGTTAAQQHSTFSVQILYKLYSVQLNCTYNNYTQAAATCSTAQQERN
jgi:hypothetical protein